MITAPPAHPLPPLPVGTRERLEPAAEALWRVIDSAGRIIGHLRAQSASDAVRYRALRIRPGTHEFVELGDFWSAADALECLRYSR